MTPRSRDIPPITDAQAEALETVNALAKQNSLRFNPRRGDMFFVNNLTLLHGRDAYEDSKEHVRYALRLWLSTPQQSLKIPKPLLPEWESTFTPDEKIKDFYNVDPWSSKEEADRIVRARGGTDSSKCG